MNDKIFSNQCFYFARVTKTRLLHACVTSLYPLRSRHRHPFNHSIAVHFIFFRCHAILLDLFSFSFPLFNLVAGNLLVIIVVVMSRRLRSITNFFLANLAVADLCVGVFCVIQTLTFYLIDR